MVQTLFLSHKNKIFPLLLLTLLLGKIHVLSAHKRNKNPKEKSFNIRKIQKILNPSLRSKRNPKKAALLSILPGAGQIYNHAYWKVPIIWGAIAGLGYWVVDNYIWYRRTGFAYEAKQKAEMGDSSLLPRVNPILMTLNTTSVKNYRDQFRQDIDQSGFWLLVGWALNMVEAAVHAHLLAFDVSKNLSMQIKPTIYPERSGNPNCKVFLSVSLRNNKKIRLLPSPGPG